MSASRFGRVVRVALGVVLIAIGLVGLILPVIPGVPLLAVGVLTVGVDHPWMRPISSRLRRHGLLRRRDSDQPR